MTTTSTNQQLNFLQEKILEIGSAIFFNLSDSVLKLPTSLVSTLKVDEFGFVWFFIQKPKQNVQEFDNEFPVRLDFFKKGKSYFLQVMGKGWVVDVVVITFYFVSNQRVLLSIIQIRYHKKQVSNG